MLFATLACQVHLALPFGEALAIRVTEAVDAMHTAHAWAVSAMEAIGG